MMEQALGYSIFIGMALAFSAVCVFGLGLTLHLGTRIRKEPLPLIFPAILVATMAMPIATGRLLTDGLMINEAALDDITSSLWITRIITLVCLALCAERLLRFVIRREWTIMRAWGLFWAFIAFAFSNQILNAIFGSHPSFDHKWLYAFPVYFSFFLIAQTQPEQCIRFVRSSLLFFFICSALIAVAMPELVIQNNYSTGLPGLSIRYFGLATHANTLGPLAIAFMICLWRFPYSSPWINRFAWFLVSTSLILSQSKTSIIIATLIGLFLLFYRYRIRLLQSSPGRSSLVIGATAFLCFFSSLAVLAAWTGTDAASRLFNELDFASRGGLTSLTGRTGIWDLAWKEFSASPLFGYGPSIWSPAYRISVGMWYATTAHNQLLQSLSAAGLVGAAGFFFYASMLIIYALKAAVPSQGTSLALVALMLSRSFTETPFTSLYAMQTEFFVHLLTMVTCIGFLPKKQATHTSKASDPARSETGWREYAR
jgi:O-antigen ligase